MHLTHFQDLPSFTLHGLITPFMLRSGCGPRSRIGISTIMRQLSELLLVGLGGEEPLGK